MQVWNVLHAARWKCRTQKLAKKLPSRHHRSTLSGHIFVTKAHIRKKLVKQQYLLHMSSQYGELRPPMAKIVPVVWGTLANFSGFRILAALLHGTPVLGVNQTLWHWTEGATYIRQGGHHVGHWRTFLVIVCRVFDGTALQPPADAVLSLHWRCHCARHQETALFEAGHWTFSYGISVCVCVCVSASVLCGCSMAASLNKWSVWSVSLAVRPHRRLHVDGSVVYTRWHHCAPPQCKEIQWFNYRPLPLKPAA